ncbi:MAG: hypothetical protein GX244_06270, partial [Firmicutes bacterium]|nr:hypothetical protein [Bacillota bacterium]
MNKFSWKSRFQPSSTPPPVRPVLPVLFLSFLTLVLLVFVGCSSQLLSQASPETGDEEEPALPVEVVEASYGNVELTI